MYTFAQIRLKMKWDSPEQVQYRTLTYMNILKDISTFKVRGWHLNAGYMALKSVKSAKFTAKDP